MCWLTGIVVVEKIPVLRQNSIRLRFQQLKYDVHHADVATDPRGNESSIPTRDQRACEGERRAGAVEAAHSQNCRAANLYLPAP